MPEPMLYQAPPGDNSGARFFYAAHGLTIASALDLPLPAAGAVACPDLEILLGTVSGEVRTGAGVRRKQIHDQFRYELTGGARLVIEPLAAARPGDVADLIVSRLLTAAMFQRGRVALHASAVEMLGGVIAVCGPSGAGKSTAAAMLVARGGRLIADDMVVLGAGDAREVWPGAPGLKLTPRSLGCLGATEAGLVRANSVEDKYRYQAPGGAAAGRIAALVVLGAGGPSATRLGPLEAAATWPVCIKMPDLIPEAGDPAAIWRQWMDFAKAVPVFRVLRGTDLDAMASLLDAVRADPAVRVGDVREQVSQ